MTHLGDKRLAAFIGVILVAALSLGGYMFQRSDASASPARDFADAVAELESSGAETAATVNGTSISMGKVKAYMVFRSTGRKVGETAADKSPRQYVESLVADELLFQEAQRRGLVPGDAEVQAMATQTKAGLIEFMKQDSAAAQALREIFAQVKGTPYGIDSYDSGVMLDNFRHTMAIGAVRATLGDELPPDERQDRSKRDAKVREVLAELRARATIEVSPLP